MNGKLWIRLLRKGTRIKIGRGSVFLSSLWQVNSMSVKEVNGFDIFATFYICLGEIGFTSILVKLYLSDDGV